MGSNILVHNTLKSYLEWCWNYHKDRKLGIACEEWALKEMEMYIFIKYWKYLKTSFTQIKEHGSLYFILSKLVTEGCIIGCVIFKNLALEFGINPDLPLTNHVSLRRLFNFFIRMNLLNSIIFKIRLIIVCTIIKMFLILR